MARRVKERPAILISKDLNKLMEEYTSRLEKKVANEGQFFRLMADAMPQIVWTALPTGQPDYFNRRWYEYTGLSEEKSLTSNTLGITHHDDIPTVQKAWKAALKSGEPYEAEFRMREARTGRYRWFLGRALAGTDSSSKIIKWFGTCTDIDEQKKAQAQKDEFIAIASHELKTPLTSIKTFAQLLGRHLEAVKDQDSLAYVTRMNSQIDRLANLVKELLDISLLDSGKLGLRKEKFDFDGFMKETIKSLQLLSDGHKIFFKGQTKANYKGDRDRIEQVLTNLVINGIKYSPKSDKIVVSCSREKSAIKVAVKDFGMGIPKKEQKHIFERFFRVDGPELETFSGLGLGLYISAEIIRKAGGEIWVDSEVGKGATFSFTLPIK